MPMRLIEGGLAVACALIFGVATACAEETVSYAIVDNAIPASLTGAPGDPAAGREVLINRRLGNCLACHVVSDLSDQPFHGDVGPTLDGVADRWDEATLRMIIVNAKTVYDGTVMPAFYRADGFTRVGDKFRGKTILTAQQVEDVVAYLMTLKD